MPSWARGSGFDFEVGITIIQACIPLVARVNGTTVRPSPGAA